MLVSRNASQAARLADRYRGLAVVESDPIHVAQTAGLIVNATPIGQRDDSQPLDSTAIPRTAAVLDLVYRRGETAWIRALRAKGNGARDGMTMLLEQGALSFRRWFGIDPDRAAMLQSLD
jgi:shikimate dehydrogenase